jgi:succinate dehydrogenase / fumarate reductase, cytochrome b subunit
MCSNEISSEGSAMADVERGNRPLSPHLQVYRWPLNMAMSIFHRVTGAALGASLALLTWWFLALAIGPEYFAFVNGLITSWLGILILLASLASIWFHLANGIRHLVWDTGSSFGKKRVLRSGQAGIAAAFLLTLVTLWVAIAY